MLAVVGYSFNSVLNNVTNDTRALRGQGCNLSDIAMSHSRTGSECGLFPEDRMKLYAVNTAPALGDCVKTPAPQPTTIPAVAQPATPPGSASGTAHLAASTQRELLASRFFETKPE